MSFPAIFMLIYLFISSGKIQIQACTFYITNRCPFPIWPATASNRGHPVVANGGFYLPSGRTRKFQTPGDWSGRIWARTGCDFTSSSNHKPACETGDCNTQLECNGAIGIPPATLVEFSLQVDRQQPSFYDVSLVDGYNLPVQVQTTDARDRGCRIGGCRRDMKSDCPRELRVVNGRGEVVACKSACLAFNRDEFCCRNAYGSPDTCGPTVYSEVFKNACPNYFTYAFDKPAPLKSCSADEYVVTFCPQKWGDQMPVGGY